MTFPPPPPQGQEPEPELELELELEREGEGEPEPKEERASPSPASADASISLLFHHHYHHYQPRPHQQEDDCHYHAQQHEPHQHQEHEPHHQEQALLQQQQEEEVFVHDEANLAVPRAIRSNLHTLADENAIDIIAGLVESDLQKRYRGGAWKDEWVATLIQLRGSMHDEFVKPQKAGVDMWARVAMGVAEIHNDFDKNSESCRKKWQRVYKAYKDLKVSNGIAATEEQAACRWFNLVDHYMCNRVSHPLVRDEQLFLDDVTDMDCTEILSVELGMNYNHDFDCPKANVKRARRDDGVEGCLSQMVETWRESLEVMKQSEARRIEILKTLSATMVGLLDVLKK